MYYEPRSRTVTAPNVGRWLVYVERADNETHKLITEGLAEKFPDGVVPSGTPVAKTAGGYEVASATPSTKTKADGVLFQDLPTTGQGPAYVAIMFRGTVKAKAYAEAHPDGIEFPPLIRVVEEG